MSCSRTQHSSTQMQEDGDCLTLLGDREIMLHVFCSLNLPGRANHSVSLRLKEKNPDFVVGIGFFYGNVCSAIGDLQMESLFCLKMFFLRPLQCCTAKADSVLVAVSLAECLQLKGFSAEPCQRSSSSSSKNTCCGFPLIVFVIVTLFIGHMNICCFEPL